MGSERLTSAIQRLDRALARVEAAAARPARPPAPDHAHEKLLERHRILRGQVEAAIKRMDVLIAAAED